MLCHLLECTFPISDLPLEDSFFLSLSLSLCVCKKEVPKKCLQAIQISQRKRRNILTHFVVIFTTDAFYFYLANAFEFHEKGQYS